MGLKIQDLLAYLAFRERGVVVPWTILFMVVFFIFSFFLVYSIVSALFGIALFRAFVTIIILGLVMGFLFKPLKTLTRETRKLVKARPLKARP